MGNIETRPNSPQKERGLIKSLVGEKYFCLKVQKKYKKYGLEVRIVSKRDKIVKTKWRMPQGLLNDLEQYPSDNGLKVSEVATFVIMQSVIPN